MSYASPSRNADPAICVHPHGFDAKGSCFDCDAKIGLSIMEAVAAGKCSAIVPAKWHTPEHRCGFSAIPGTDRCGTHRRDAVQVVSLAARHPAVLPNCTESQHFFVLGATVGDSCKCGGTTLLRRQRRSSEGK